MLLGGNTRNRSIALPYANKKFAHNINHKNQQPISSCSNNTNLENETFKNLWRNGQPGERKGEALSLVQKKSGKKTKLKKKRERLGERDQRGRLSLRAGKESDRESRKKDEGAESEAEWKTAKWQRSK